MAARLAHRGPDDEGIWEEGDACLAHRRLSIIDLSEAARQPMSDGTRVLVCNGEIYNFRELRKELEDLGATFRSRSDSEVLLHGFREWGGDALLARVKGMFAFAIWDAGTRRLFCARDPFGKKPLYYRLHDGKMVFASELPALVEGVGCRPSLSETSVAYYLLKGYFPPGETVFSGVRCLRAGCSFQFDASNGALIETAYEMPRFRLPEGTLPGHEETVLEFAGKFSAAVERRHQSDVPVGVLLSGGVDSSLVALLSAEGAQRGLKTFTATFGRSEFDESEFAREIAACAASEHKELPVLMDDIPSLLPRLVRAYGEPFGDYSSIPTFLIFEALGRHVKVALTGDGGDEVFAGYKDLEVFLLRDRLRPFLGLGDLLSFVLPKDAIYSRHRRVREIGYLPVALSRGDGPLFFSLFREGWTSPWRNWLFRPETLRRFSFSEMEDRSLGQFRESGRTDLERYLNAMLERLTQMFMVKVDRASMAHSVEARSPMLDIDLFRWAVKLPKQALLHGGVAKSIPKELLRRRAGAALAFRRKMGFTPPLRQWLRGRAGGDWVRGKLTCPDSFARSVISPEGVESLLQRHRTGEDHSGRIWKLLFLSEWEAATR